MQKARLIVMLTLVCVCMLVLPAMAQLPSTNWPKFGHDYQNSSYNGNATAIAKPVLKFAPVTLGSRTVNPSWPNSTTTGIVVDPDGYAYASDWWNTIIRKVAPDGTLQTWTAAVPEVNYWGYNNGLVCTLDGTTKGLIFFGQSSTTTSADTATENTADGRRIYMINPDTGALIYSSTRCWERVTGMTENGTNPYTTPAVGPDGSMYLTNLRSAPYEPEGGIFAYDKSGARKWAYTAKGLGECYGTAAVKQISDGGVLKNVIYVTGGLYQARAHAADPYPALYAIKDNGTTCEVLWSKTELFTTAMPVLSDDGSTLYVAGRENWPLQWSTSSAGSSRSTGRAVPGTFYAFNADTGAQKWVINTGSRHAMPPALGKNGMIYVAGGPIKGWQNTRVLDPPLLVSPGKIIAIKDNGDTGEVKWTLPLPDDEVSETTNLVTINTNPVTMYVGTSNGHFYCVQDKGDHGQILWAFCGDIPIFQHRTRIKTPAGLAVADDGTLYTGVNNMMYAFDASGGGFNPLSPVGISGTVKDAAGNPIAGAWVAISTSAKPLADNLYRCWTKTNPDGSYVIAANTAGTYYVAAAANGYSGSDDQTVTLATTSSAATADFILSPAKYNWARISAVSATNQSATPAYQCNKAVDGDINTRFVTGSTASRLTMDLGAPATISEAVINWWYNFGYSYSVQYSNDGSTWTSAYSTTTGNGGFPQDWYPSDPIAGYPPFADNTLINAGGLKTGVDVVKFPAVPARYWSVNITSVACPHAATSNLGTITTDYGQIATYGSIWEVELRDATMAGNAGAANIKDAKDATDGQPALLSGVYVTAVAGGGVPANTLFVENADRSAGMRVQVTGLPDTIQVGDKVNVGGRVQSDVNGKYIQAANVLRMDATTSPASPALAELSMSNKAAADPISQGLFIKTWGTVSASATGSFMLTDGSAAPIKVLCNSDGLVTMPVNGDNIRVRGVVGVDASGPVLYMRNERADWAYAADDMHALPLTGKYKYPIQYLVLGPFVDATKTTTDLLDYDFIGETSVGTTIMPAEGLVTAGMTWTKATSASAVLSLDTSASSVCYAHIYVWSEIDSPDVAVATGSDDALKYFVNGTQAFRIDGARGIVIGKEFTPLSATPLHAGLNSILFKVVNVSGTHSLASQIVDGAPIGGQGYGGYTPYTTTGIGYSLNPATP